jgi:hypothetical protein
VFPGNSAITIPGGTQGAVPAGVRILVHEGGRVRHYNSSFDNQNANRLDPILNVKEFDTFQAAHDALPSTGGTIYIPAGHYSHATKPAFGSGSVAGMVVTKDGVCIRGEGSTSSFLRNFASGSNNQHGFDVRANSFQMSGLQIDGPDSAGTGCHVYWNKSSGTATGLLLEDVNFDRSSSWGLRAHATVGNFLNKIRLINCQFGNAKSGGDVRIGDSQAPPDNIRIVGCEFSSKGYNSMRALGISAAGTLITVATSSPHLSRTDANGGLAMLANGDLVYGVGIPQGAKITGLSTGGATDTADLTIAPTSAGTRGLRFMREGSVGSGWLPTGSVHLVGGGNYRFVGCSWQGIAESVGLSLLSPLANVFLNQCYREYGTPFTNPLPFITVFGDVDNVIVDGFYMQSNTANPKLFESGDLNNAFTSAQNIRFRGCMVTTNQNPPTVTDAFKLNVAADDVEIEDSYSFSSATGARYPLAFSGSGAGFMAVASVAGTMTLPNATASVFSVTGTSTITSITAQHRGRVVILVFASTAGLTDGSNLKLDANFTGAADRSITLLCDGTNWIELARHGAS